LTWESPSANSDVGNPVAVNISDSDGDNNGSYDIYYKQSEESNWSDASPSNVNDDGVNTTFDWDTTNLDGDYTLNVTNSSSYTDTITRNFTVDNTAPTVDSFTPSDGTFTGGSSGNGDDIDISYSSSDSDAGVEFENISIDGEDNNDTSNSLSSVSLSDGSYTVNYWANDSVGNVASGSWSFKVDTSYDGDESPSVDIEGEDNGVVDYNEDTDIDVDFESADSTSDTTATCVVGGDNIDSNTFSSASSGNNELTCTLDDSDDDYYDTTATVEVEIEDEADNSKTYEYGDVVFDAEAPTVSELESSTGLDTFNDDFDVEYSAFDDASSVDGAEYYFDDSTNTGDGTSVSDGEFTADLSDLESGSHTLYVRAQDEASRWSNPEAFNFEYYPDRDPEVSLSVSTSVNVTAGESTEFDVKLENTGDFYIESVNLNIESDLISENETVSGLEPGDSITKSFQAETSEEDIGEYSVDVSTEGPESSDGFDLRVRANEDQKQDIESTLSEYEDKLESLQANISELEGSISEEQSTKLSSNMSDFKSNIEEAREAVEADRYYKANSDLNNIDSDFSKAKNTYENVRDEYQSNRRLKMILGGFAFLIFGGLGAIFVLNREDIIDIDEHVNELGETAGDLDTDTEGIGLGAVKEKLSEILDREPDAEEFEWDGFKD